jgi:hypothetical protein
MEIPNITATRRLKEDARETTKESTINQNLWRFKCKNGIIHGQYVRNVDGKFIKEKGTNFWIRNRQLKG